jgi:hypothetical protein
MHPAKQGQKLANNSGKSIFGTSADRTRSGGYLAGFSAPFLIISSGQVKRCESFTSRIIWFAERSASVVHDPIDSLKI